MISLVKQATYLAFLAFLLSGCVTGGAITSGEAKLIPGSVSASFSQIDGLVDVKGERKTIFVHTTDCEKGTGTLFYGKGYQTFVDDDAGSIENVMLRGQAPADRLFAQLCAAGMQIIVRAQAEEAARWAAMTPEQRAAAQTNRRKLLEIMLMQQQMQHQTAIEEARNKANTEAARELGNAIRDTKRSTTSCYTDAQGYTHCTTQ